MRLYPHSAGIILASQDFFGLYMQCEEILQVVLVPIHVLWDEVHSTAGAPAEDDEKQSVPCQIAIEIGLDDLKAFRISSYINGRQ